MPTKNEMAATMTRDAAARAGVLMADEAGAVISKNSKKLFGFSRKMLPEGLPQDPKLYIFSVSEYGEIVNLGAGFRQYAVHPCPEGADYGEPCVILPLNFFEEMKVDQTEHTFHSGEQLADAILKIGPGMVAIQDKRRYGWFKSYSNPPLAEEVQAAKNLYTVKCQELFQAANRYYAANQLSEITDEHRRASRWLGQKVQWEKTQKQNIECPGCGEPVVKGVIWHATPHGCGYIFDLEAYDERFPGNRNTTKRKPKESNEAN